MANVVTVRNAGGVLQCFGPDNGMYEPVVHPGWVKAIEPDYASVLNEWLLTSPPRQDKVAMAINDARIPQWFKDWVAL